MKRRLVFPVALVLLATFPVLGQRGQEHGQERGQDRPRANQGRVPPPPERRDNPHAKPEPERHVTGHVNTTPHVNKDHWYGHDRPDDKRYHVDHPFEHGRFEHFGPSYRYRIERFDPDIIAFGCRAVSTLKLHLGTGRFVPIGAGTVAMTS